MTAALRVGLIGAGIQQSRTPAMHMAEAAAQGLTLRYDLLDIDTMAEADRDFATILAEAEAAGYSGVNVTYPFKQAALDHLDRASDEVRAVGATNTIVFQDGKRIGHNTDYWGFAENLRRGLDGVPKALVLMLGAGGAGGAVAHALLDVGVGHLAVCDVRAEAAEALVANLQARHGTDRASVVTDGAAAVPGVDGIVNASPVGMAKLPGTPVPTALLHPGQWVADVVYFPLVTQFLAEARARGCRSLDGSGMALFQAVRAFELFTGRTADPVRMRATFDSFDDPG